MFHWLSTVHGISDSRFLTAGAGEATGIIHAQIMHLKLPSANFDVS
jgi:hypothetical protein